MLKRLKFVLFLLPVLLLFPPLCSPANIFSGAILTGSHVTAIYDLILILAESGHNVTFINIAAGELDRYPPHPNIHRVDIIVWDKDKDMMSEHCLKEIVLGPSSEALSFNAACEEVWREVYSRAASVYTGDTVLDLFKQTQFDVIIGEKVEVTGMAILGTFTHVPVINYEPTFLIIFSQLHNNIPLLLSSQPSLLNFNYLGRPASLVERLYEFSGILTFTRFGSVGVDAMIPFLHKFGFKEMSEVRDSVKLFLTNDHPAFTFPFLRPPNDIPIGCANLLGTKKEPLEFSPQISQFIDASAGKDIIYVSLGSFVKMSDVSWYPKLIGILIKLDLRVIVKVDKKSKMAFPDAVLPLSWAPQKDILRSGKLKLFISHCGNNGMLEAVYYNVPTLCIPQFGDQPVCAAVLESRGFGEVLLKEEIEEKSQEMVTKMLTNHGIYLENMRKASEVVDSEPGNVRAKLLWHVDYVSKHKQAEYLVNRVLRQQSLAEMYNLDIFVGATAVVILVIILIVRLLISFRNIFFLKMFSKT